EPVSTPGSQTGVAVGEFAVSDGLLKRLEIRPRLPVERLVVLGRAHQLDDMRARLALADEAVAGLSAFLRQILQAAEEALSDAFQGHKRGCQSIVGMLQSQVSDGLGESPGHLAAIAALRFKRATSRSTKKRASDHGIFSAEV